MKILKFLKSLKFRLFISINLLGFVLLFVMRFGVLYTYESQAVSAREANILSQSKILAGQLARSGYMNGYSRTQMESQIEQLANIYSGRVLIVNEVFHIIKDTYNIDTDKIIISDEVARSFQGNELTIYDDGGRFIEITIPVKDDDTDEILGVLIASVSTDEIVNNIEKANEISYLMIFALGTLLVIVSIVVVMMVDRPMKRLSGEIKEVSAGTSDEFAATSHYPEFSQIREDLNNMLKRMRIMDESRQEFVSNVSHELKTPLTSMKVLADSLNSQSNLPVEIYQDFMKDITSEIDRENKIITDLLELVKYDNKAVMVFNVEQVNINNLLEKIMKRMQPIAGAKGINLVLESFRPVVADGDETKFSQIFTNLIENAVKYNDKENGYVHVSLNADHQFFYVRVEDNGMGMPEESLEHIYERFYRVDKSHSREIGGTGLGLAITKSAINLHRGTIKVYSAEGEGTTFSVRIPLIYKV